MWVKREIEQLGVKVEIKNISEDAAAKEQLKKEDILTVPVLQVHKNYITDVKEILKFVGAKEAVK